MQLKNSLGELSPLAKTLVLLIIILFGVLITSSILLGLNLAFFHYPIDLLNQLTIESNKDWIMAGKGAQMISQIGMFVLPALVFAYLTSNSVKSELSFGKTLSFRVISVVVIVTLLCIPFINFLAEWNALWHLPDFLAATEDWMRRMQEMNDGLLEVFVQMNTPFDIAINVLMMAVIPAIGEELIFRGVIQTQLTKGLKSPHVAIILTAILFSAFHMQFLGFLSRALLGMLFGYFFYWSKNIWLPIIAHFVNNSLALLLVLIYGSETAMHTDQEYLSWPVGLISFGLMVIGVFVLIRQKPMLQPAIKVKA